MYIVLGIGVVYVLLFLFRNNYNVKIVISILTSVTLWYGLWNLMDAVSTELGILHDPKLSSVMFISIGAALTVLEAGTVRSAWDATMAHF